MDRQTETQAPVYLYEALSPLSLSHPDQSPPPARSPPAEPEPYSVFRNEISLETEEFSAVGSAAPDFFSLDVESGLEERDQDAGWVEDSGLKTPLFSEKKSKKKSKKDKAALDSAKETEPMLESSWFSGNSRFESPMLQLHKEIVDFSDFLSPTPEELAARNAAVESVFGVIKYIWPQCKVEVFGSFRTGLYLPTSDIDVVILESGCKKPQFGLKALSRALAQRGIAKNIQVIGKARVPIVKFVEKKSRVAFDISFDVDNGPKAAEFIKDAVLKWPPIRPLCLILKVFLQQRELNEVYHGGIGSYALLTMLMAMLKSVNDGRASPEHNLGVLLVNFFDFYGRKLNTTDVGVSCNGGGTFFSKINKGFTNKGRPFLLSIEDPQAPENDIGKNSFNYFQIRSAFAMAFTTLTNPKTILSLGPNRSILGTIMRPDPALVERKGGQSGNVTFASLLPGAGEPIQSNFQAPQELLCNWQFDDEEPLPRGAGMNGDLTPEISRKKRKTSSKDKSSKKKKVKENGDAEKVRHEENGLKKEKSSKKKQRWRLKRHESRSSNGSPWKE